MKELYLVIALITAYLLGSISFSYLLAKRVKGMDIRKHGSGNAGATNTLRVMGKGPAVLVLLLDIGKGILAVAIAHMLTNDPMWWMISGLLAIIGHNWPIFFGFRGGKGIATTIGVTLALMWKVALVSIAIAILFIIITRFVSLGSLLYTVSLPIGVYFFSEYPVSFLWLSLLMMVVSIVQHRSNINNLIQGKERKI